MGLSNNQIKALLHSVALTRPREATCDECVKDLAEFAEVELAGKSVPDALQAVVHHLAICQECREEYEALQQAMQDIGE